MHKGNYTLKNVVAVDQWLNWSLSAGLSHEQNTAKMRLLTLMGMAVENKEISFDTLQQELQIPEEEVEAFVIDGKQSQQVISNVCISNKQV